MRFFKCKIQNEGNGDIQWVDDHLEHGEWMSGKGPSEETRVIPPGEQKEFGAQSGGEIPVIDSIGTGTEGHAIFRTNFEDFIGSNPPGFIKIAWNIPFITLSSESTGGSVEATRFDPRLSPGSAAFDTRDTRPPGIRLRAFVSGGNEGGDSPVDGLPWLFIFPPFYVSGADIGSQILLTVFGTAPPGKPSRLPPFTNEQSVRPIPEPMRFSTAEMWEGHWAGDQVFASIDRETDNRFQVTITESPQGGPSYSFQSTDLSISRAMLALPNGAAPAMDLPAAARSLRRSIGVTVHQGIETSQATVKTIDPNTQLYISALSHPDIASTYVSHQIQVGGDYLSLQNNAMLEIYQLTVKGKPVDVALRYRRPAGNPMTQITQAGLHFDELLRFRPNLG